MSMSNRPIFFVSLTVHVHVENVGQPRDVQTFNCVMTLLVGEENPRAVIALKVGAWIQKCCAIDGMVINCPNRLYVGRENEAN
jgi:hypothetical protein